MLMNTDLDMFTESIPMAPDTLPQDLELEGPSGGFQEAHPGDLGLAVSSDPDEVDLSDARVADIVSDDVVDAVMGMVQRLASEGVEGRTVNLKVLIGRKMDLYLNTSQRILDPTMGYGDDRPSVLDEDMYHVIKSWALLSGCLGMDEKGNILFAGRELSGKKTLWEECQWALEASRRMDVIAIHIVERNRIAVCTKGDLQFIYSEDEAV